MKGFVIKTAQGIVIRFGYYHTDAPVTVAAFNSLLPFTLSFCHARVSGQEFWRANAFPCQMIQENASVFTVPGEAVWAPNQPARNKAAGGLGIYYGEGHGLDACNIFAKAYAEDMPALKLLGEEIWKKGEQELTFETL